MIRCTQGNILEADAEALVNTVNTVGVMGKGVALMFKEAFPDNFTAYKRACDANELNTGRVFVTERRSLTEPNPRWIVNFPTKQHWRNPTQIEWVKDGLQDLRAFIVKNSVKSVAVPPLGCGNGGLAWNDVRPLIEDALGDIPNVDVLVYEPTAKYQNVAKRSGVEELTPPRAMIVEAVRQYVVLDMECSLIEVQKLGWLLERAVVNSGLPNPFDFRFAPNRYGPFSQPLMHLLDKLDGSYLGCDKRIADARPEEPVYFKPDKRDAVDLYLRTEAKEYGPAMEKVWDIIDGFQSPFGMELLATVDWILENKFAAVNPAEVRGALAKWPGGEGSGARKLKIFNERSITLALDRLAPNGVCWA